MVTRLTKRRLVEPKRPISAPIDKLHRFGKRLKHLEKVVADDAGDRRSHGSGMESGSDNGFNHLGWKLPAETPAAQLVQPLGGHMAEQRDRGHIGSSPQPHRVCRATGEHEPLDPFRMSSCKGHCDIATERMPDDHRALCLGPRDNRITDRVHGCVKTERVITPLAVARQVWGDCYNVAV